MSILNELLYLSQVLGFIHPRKPADQTASTVSTLFIAALMIHSACRLVLGAHTDSMRAAAAIVEYVAAGSPVRSPHEMLPSALIPHVHDPFCTAD